MDVSLKHPFSMIVSGERCAVKTEFTKKLLKRKLIAPPSERYSIRVEQLFPSEQKKSHYTARYEG